MALKKCEICVNCVSRMRAGSPDHGAGKRGSDWKQKSVVPMPLLHHASKLSALVLQRRRVNGCQWCQNDNVTLNGTPLLMNDKANCGNGLLLFGLDKYSDK